MDLNAPLGQFLGQIGQGDIRNLPDTQQHIGPMIAQFTTPITALPLWRHRPTRQILRNITYRTAELTEILKTLAACRREWPART